MPSIHVMLLLLHSLAPTVVDVDIRVVKTLDKAISNTTGHSVQRAVPVARRKIGLHVVKVEASGCERVLDVVDDTPLDRVNI